MSTQTADKYWDSCYPVQRWTPYGFVGVWTAFPTSQPSLTRFLGVFLSAAQTPEVKLTAAAAATFCLWEPHWCSSPSPSPVPVPVPHQGRMGFPSAEAEAGGTTSPYISLNVGESFVTPGEAHICAAITLAWVTWLQKPEDAHLISHTCNLSGRCILGNATVSQAQRGTGRRACDPRGQMDAAPFLDKHNSLKASDQQGNHPQGLYSVGYPTVMKQFKPDLQMM